MDDWKMIACGIVLQDVHWCAAIFRYVCSESALSGLGIRGMSTVTALIHNNFFYTMAFNISPSSSSAGFGLQSALLRIFQDEHNHVGVAE